MTTLAIARLAGLSYHEVRDLPLSVYEVLVEDLAARHAQQEAIA
jgi:hypothetical protein